MRLRRNRLGGAVWITTERTETMTDAEATVKLQAILGAGRRELPEPDDLDDLYQARTDVQPDCRGLPVEKW